MTRILIADDHEVVRSGLRAIIEAHRKWEVVGEAIDGRDAIHKAGVLKPDIAILDYSLPHINGIEATRQILARVPGVEVLIFTAQDTEALIFDCLKAGARGYLLKSGAKSELIIAIEALIVHRPFFSDTVSEALVSSYLASNVCESPLTPRERCVLQIVAEGHGNKKAATLLGISVKTVETHRASIMRKLAIPSIAGLVRYAVRNRIIEA